MTGTHLELLVEEPSMEAFLRACLPRRSVGLHHQNDSVQICARRSDGAFTPTDDGYPLEDLEQTGGALDSRDRQDLLKMTLNGFGLQLEGSGLGAPRSRCP
jgi:hypothetical protein